MPQDYYTQEMTLGKTCWYIRATKLFPGQNFGYWQGDIQLREGSAPSPVKKILCGISRYEELPWDDAIICDAGPCESMKSRPKKPSK